MEKRRGRYWRKDGEGEESGVMEEWMNGEKRRERMEMGKEKEEV